MTADTFGFGVEYTLPLANKFDSTVHFSPKFAIGGSVKEVHTYRRRTLGDIERMAGAGNCFLLWQPHLRQTFFFVEQTPR
jgi:hypothetical protein